MALFTGVTWRPLALVIVDHLLLVGSVLGAYVLRLGLEQLTHVDDPWALIWRVELIAVVVQVLLHYCDLYDPRVAHNRRDALIGLVQALGVASLIMAVIYYWCVGTLGRASCCCGGLHRLVDRLCGPLRGCRSPRTGRAPPDRRHERGGRRPGRELTIDGTASAWSSSGSSPPRGQGGHAGAEPGVIAPSRTSRYRPGTSRRSRGRHLADARGKFSMDKLLAMKLNRASTRHLASLRTLHGKIAIENLRPSWLISRGFQSLTLQAAKRTLDLVWRRCCCWSPGR